MSLPHRLDKTIDLDGNYFNFFLEEIGNTVATCALHDVMEPAIIY